MTEQLDFQINTTSYRESEIKILGSPEAVLADIKQTPRYWKKAKYEMFAKLDNFGPFHFFFTLSCADLRWDENFAAILRARECTVKYEMEDDQDGYPRTAIMWSTAKMKAYKLTH